MIRRLGGIKNSYDLPNHLGCYTEMLYNFRWNLEGKLDKELLESAGLEFYRKDLTVTLPYPMQKSSRQEL